VKIRCTLRHLGLADSMTNLWSGADATVSHSHISGGRTFSHCHDVCGLTHPAQCMLSAANFLELCLWAPGRPAMVVARRGRSL